jgi:AcrR family transcriptional regulator
MAINPDDFALGLDEDNKYKKGIETRDRIFSEAIKLFHEQGFANTSIRQLINRVGRSSSVVYNHFRDKEDILFMITRRTGEKTLGMLAEIKRLNEEPEACLKAMIGAMIHFVDHPSMVKEIAIFNNEAHHLPAKRRKIINQQYLGIVRDFEDVLAQIGKKKKGKKRVNDKVAAFSILSSINWFYLWYRKDGELSLEAIGDEIIRFIFHGLD